MSTNLYGFIKIAAGANVIPSTGARSKDINYRRQPEPPTQQEILQNAYGKLKPGIGNSRSIYDPIRNNPKRYNLIPQTSNQLPQIYNQFPQANNQTPQTPNQTPQSPHQLPQRPSTPEPDYVNKIRQYRNKAINNLPSNHYNTIGGYNR